MELDELIKIFEKDLTVAFLDVQEFRKIFTENDIDYKILNETAPNFFLTFQRYFWNNVILSISRFIDPPESFSNYNLTIDILVKLAEDNNLSCLEEIKRIIGNVREKSKKIKLWRSKIIAHRDVGYALKSNFDDMKIYLSEVEEILDSIGNCVNKVYFELKNKTIYWQPIPSDNAEALMFFLRDGLIYSQLKKKRRNPQLDNQELEESDYYDKKG
jgi:hypothetical protein